MFKSGSQPDPRLSIAVFAPLYPPAFKGGGPIRTLEALVREAPPKFDVTVLAGDRETNEAERLPVNSNVWTHFEHSKVYYVSVDNARRILQGYMAVRRESPALLYLNSFFDLKLSIFPQLLWRAGLWRQAGRLVAPRGEFGKAALERKSLKKNAFIAIYRALRLDSNVTWHASSVDEAADIKALWGDRSRIIVRSNETSLPIEPIPAPPTNDGQALKAVFVGRLVEHKGLLIVLNALQHCVSVIELDVYGPEEDASYVNACRDLASKLPSRVRVRFKGSLRPDLVRPTLNTYDVLMMPTAGENFGHVIAEALSASCVVVCTPFTPWSPILNEGGGVVVDGRNPAQWTKAIDFIAGESVTALAERRIAAGQAYKRWRTRGGGPHVFELWLEKQVAS